jgi:type IV secretion system protein TrbG
MIKKSTSVSGLFTLTLLSAIGTAHASLEAKVPASAGKPIILDEPSASPLSPPFPGQLKRLPQELLPPPARRSHLSSSPRDKVGAANHAVRVEPHAQGFVNAIQQYPWADGALYQVYARPGNVTDIALQEGEKLVGPGPVAAGDTARWMIGDTVSGTGPASRVHILVKPVRTDIATNLVIHTDRRTYHIELRANPSVYMASVSWTYPQDELIALHAQQAEAERVAPITTGMDPALLDFRYEIKGDDPDWRPLRAFNDGVRVFVEFPESIAQGELPPLFVLGANGEAELVNYRVSGRYMIVDRLFGRAELRLGGRKGQQTVRIVSYRKGRK